MSPPFPVLILAFNRPDCTERLLAAASMYCDPNRLYIAVDGPRDNKPGDAAKVSEVRAIVERIPRPMRTKTLLRKKNLGCRRAVSEAITWFFENEEAGIILEDDIEPSEGFFRFCEYGLREYSDDPSILHIAGSLYLGPYHVCPRAEVFKTTCPHVWGWATWRRAWRLYDSSLVERPGRERRKWIRQAVSDWRSVLFYDLAFTLTKQEKMNSWAFRWYLSTWKAGGYSLCPASNLVRNVGIGVDSTHSRFEFHVANPAVGSFELPLTREPLAYDRSVSERFHLFYNRADSPWKLMRMYLSTLVSRRTFTFLRGLSG